MEQGPEPIGLQVPKAVADALEPLRPAVRWVRAVACQASTWAPAADGARQPGEIPHVRPTAVLVENVGAASKPQRRRWWRCAVLRGRGSLLSLQPAMHYGRGRRRSSGESPTRPCITARTRHATSGAQLLPACCRSGRWRGCDRGRSRSCRPRSILLSALRSGRRPATVRTRLTVTFSGGHRPSTETRRATGSSSSGSSTSGRRAREENDRFCGSRSHHRHSRRRDSGGRATIPTPRTDRTLAAECLRAFRTLCGRWSPPSWPFSPTLVKEAAVWDAEGRVVTIRQVVADATRVEVAFADGKRRRRALWLPMPSLISPSSRAPGRTCRLPARRHPARSRRTGGGHWQSSRFREHGYGRRRVGTSAIDSRLGGPVAISRRSHTDRRRHLARKVRRRIGFGLGEGHRNQRRLHFRLKRGPSRSASPSPAPTVTSVITELIRTGEASHPLFGVRRRG